MLPLAGVIRTLPTCTQRTESARTFRGSRKNARELCMRTTRRLRHSRSASTGSPVNGRVPSPKNSTVPLTSLSVVLTRTTFVLHPPPSAKCASRSVARRNGGRQRRDGLGRHRNSLRSLIRCPQSDDADRRGRTERQRPAKPDSQIEWRFVQESRDLRVAIEGEGARTEFVSELVRKAKRNDNGQNCSDSRMRGRY